MEPRSPRLSAWSPFPSPGGRGDRSAVPPQTVKKLLEQKRRQQTALGYAASSQVPTDVIDSSQTDDCPEPMGLGRGSGGESAPGPPLAPYPPWQVDPSCHATFPDCHYHCSTTASSYQSPGPMYEATDSYASVGTGVFGAGDPYSTMMAATGDLEVPVPPPSLGLFPTLQASSAPWMQPIRSTPYSDPLELGSFGDPVGVLDPGELARARAEIRSMDPVRLLHQDEDGDTILHLLAARGLRHFAQAAAEAFKECGQLEIKEHKGKTPLLVAATANQAELVRDLLVLGADANAADHKGQTLLHLAATYGFPNVLMAVMASGVPVNVEARNFEGQTPLHCAVISHNKALRALGVGTPTPERLQDMLACIQALLHMGADYTSQDIKSSKTVLHLAVQDGNLSLVQFFLQLPGPRQFVNMKAHGNTALHMAAALPGPPCQESLVRLLLSRGADPSARNLENEQPAHLLPPGPGGDQLRLLLKSRRPPPGAARRPAQPP
ncbi:NF-kappa-B inhibitor delta isoform X3 [Caretta caretta]|uniref:NF-kappa-B inhibitor delta isoform X3 n=1 Tax=Caretta caretta TaxID=8467 RepID=UPI002095F15F|nr:NF-kappa-B inhibitor delta isoform X3 [Caretta caretta]